MLRNTVCALGLTLVASTAHAEVMCAKLTNGKLRMAPFCKSSERQIAEKQVASYTTTAQSCEIVDLGLPAGFFVAVAECPTGTMMTGGGAECSIMDNGNLLAGATLFLNEMVITDGVRRWFAVCDTLMLGGLTPLLCATATCATTTLTP